MVGGAHVPKPLGTQSSYLLVENNNIWPCVVVFVVREGLGTQWLLGSPTCFSIAGQTISATQIHSYTTNPGNHNFAWLPGGRDRKRRSARPGRTLILHRSRIGILSEDYT